MPRARDTDPVIREARLDDVEGVVTLHHLTRETCMPYLPVLHTVAEGIEYFTEVVFRECRVLVVEDDGRIVSYCAFREGWLDHLYVSPDAQRRGLGSTLLKAATESQDTLSLWVFQKNLGARHFYERHGFSPIELTDGQTNEEHEPDALYRWKRST